MHPANHHDGGGDTHTAAGRQTQRWRHCISLTEGRRCACGVVQPTARMFVCLFSSDSSQDLRPRAWRARRTAPAGGCGPACPSALVSRCLSLCAILAVPGSGEGCETTPTSGPLRQQSKTKRSHTLVHGNRAPLAALRTARGPSTEVKLASLAHVGKCEQFTAAVMLPGLPMAKFAPRIMKTGVNTHWICVRLLQTTAPLESNPVCNTRSLPGRT